MLCLLQGNHSVVQLATAACPTAATPATAQRTLVAPTVNGSASLFIPDPGTVGLSS